MAWTLTDDLSFLVLEPELVPDVAGDAEIGRQVVLGRQLRCVHPANQGKTGPIVQGSGDRLEALTKGLCQLEVLWTNLVQPDAKAFE